jgi:site-specific DNA recombinase
MTRAAAPICCVLYARSSKDLHDIAPQTQLKELRAFAQRRGYRIVGERQDAAVSANDDPPQLTALVGEFANRSRGWTVILAVDASRIARDINKAGYIAYIAGKAGCRIEYARTPSSGHAAMDLMFESFERVQAQVHSMTSKEKGLAGMRTTVELGHRAGGRAPLGYRLVHTTTGQRRQGQLVKKSTLALDPDWAPKVKRFLTLRAAGRGRKIAAELSGLGAIKQTSLIGMERNALTYAGHTVWNRHIDRKLRGERYRPRSEWLIQRGTHPALIEEEKAEALMNAALPKGRKRGTSRMDFLLTGLLFTPAGEKFAASGDDYYRVGKGRRIPADALEAIVLDQINEERDGREFVEKFIAEAKRAAASIVAAPKELEAERKSIARRLAAWVKMAEAEPGSPTIMQQLRQLEGEQERVEHAIRDSESNAKVKRWLSSMTPEDARQMIETCRIEDGATVDQRRAALAALVDRIEFDPTNGKGRVLYRVGLNGAKFDVRTAEAKELVSSYRGMVASPRGFEPRLPP